MKNKIREFRMKKGFTQAELAKIVGVSRNAISSFENNNYMPTAYVAGLIVKALDCKFEEVFIYEKSEIKGLSNRDL